LGIGNNNVVVAWEGCSSRLDAAQPTTPAKNVQLEVALFDDRLRRLWGPISFSDRYDTMDEVIEGLSLVQFRTPRRPLCVVYIDKLDRSKGKYAIFDARGRSVWGRTGPKVISEEHVRHIAVRPAGRGMRVGLYCLITSGDPAGLELNIDDQGNVTDRFHRERDVAGVSVGTWLPDYSNWIFREKPGYTLVLRGSSVFKFESLQETGASTACPLSGERFLLLGGGGYAVCDREGSFVHDPVTYPGLALRRLSAMNMPNGDILVAGLEQRASESNAMPGRVACLRISDSGEITRGPTRIAEGLYMGLSSGRQALAPFQDDKALLVAQSGSDLVYYVLA
jgi:hypothetical protein